MAPLPNCPLNASYLKNALAVLPLGERDATWSAYLVGKQRSYDDEWSAVQQIVDWAWVAPKSEVEPEKIHQVGLALALMTSTMDRGLRDCATKALASLLVKFPSGIPALIDEFADWDDPYVRERVLAATSAAVLYCVKPEIIKEAALAVDRMVFQKTPVERHAWTRRYAQAIVDHAAYNSVGVSKELLTRSAPPYASERIDDWPTLSQIASYRESARSIFSSVIGYISTPFDGTPPTMAGDFGRYTMGSIDNYFSKCLRGLQPPLPRKKEVEIFWTKVKLLDSKTQSAEAELRNVAKRRGDAWLDGFLKACEPSQREGIADLVVDQKQYEKAERTLLELLPNKLKAEYERLKPLEMPLDNRIPMFSQLKGQCWVFSRTLELGWCHSLHEEIERKQLRHSYSRYDHKVERIGKKYQHIAFAELIGYLADYHWFVDWNKVPSILNRLEDFDRADIDATYLSGSFSKPIETYLPAGVSVPEMTFVADNPNSNMEWTKTIEDIPEPTAFFVQTDDAGLQWYVQQSFCRSKDYMKGFESNEPFRSAQYEIELVLVDKSELKRIERPAIDGATTYDLFRDGRSSPSLFGQRSFKHLPGSCSLPRPCEAFNFHFLRIDESYTPKYSGYDCSRVSDEPSFSTPHPALLAALKLRPKDAWSNFFVTVDGEPAYCDAPAFLGGSTFIRRDLLDQFADAHDLQIVWKVWVEKDGGLGTNRGGSHGQFARRDFIGFYFERDGSWVGTMFPFRH